MADDLAITSVEALPCSVPLKHAVSQGLGQAVKRDTVFVKVTTAGGLTGYGEAYNGRAPLAVAQTVNTTLRHLFTGMDAAATTAVWACFESRVLANHGTCAGCVCAMSGIDMALWDIKGKALGLPLYRLLGGTAGPIPAYAGRDAARIATVPLAAGENCYTRYDFQRLLDAGCVSVMQPDLSRCGGITEALSIAALASAAGLPVCTHGCHTGLNMAASVHFLAAIDNARYFEGDGSTDNPLRTRACSASYELRQDGTVTPLEGSGLGVDVDENFIRAHPVTEGPAWH